VFQDYFGLPTDAEGVPNGTGSGGVDRETSDEYEGKRELPRDEWGDYAEDDDSDTDSSDLGEGTSIAGLLGLAARQAEANGTLERTEPIPEKREGADKELEDFDPRDFPTYFSDGTLDLIEEHDHNSDNPLFSDSDDEDDDAQDLGHLEHILRDGAPVGLRIREVRPGAVENLAGVGGIGQQNGPVNGVVNPPGNDQVDPAAPAQEANEEMEPNLDDDMEGAMEAIGLRGPVLTVLQNVGVALVFRPSASTAHLLVSGRSNGPNSRHYHRFQYLDPFHAWKVHGSPHCMFPLTHLPRELTKIFVAKPTADDTACPFADSSNPIRYRSYRGLGWARAPTRIFRAPISNLSETCRCWILPLYLG